MGRKIAAVWRWGAGLQRRSRAGRMGVLWLLLGSLLGGAAFGAAQHPLEAIYARATHSAGAVLLFKPTVQDTQNWETLLAPFILQSTGDAEEEIQQGRRGFGVPLPASGSVTQAVVYYLAAPISVGGLAHTQMLYLWLYAEADFPEALPAQGVRITLNPQGFPVIWEMLAAPQNRQEVYVAGSIEHASLQHFGGRLPGRRFAVEPALERAPRLVMPAVVEDSPVVFGPMVYLERRTHGPHAVICRCMPALATQIVDTLYYDLQPWPADALKRLRTRRDGAGLAQLLEDFQRQPPLKRLRLPSR